MKREMSCAALLAALACPWAAASTQIVDLTALNSTTTLGVPFAGNENLLVNTLATGAPGALTNTVVFTVGAGVTSFSGAAAWEVNTAGALDPRLVGVNIDIFDASNVLVATDTVAGVANGWATSTLGASLTPGTYRLVMTGTGVRAELDGCVAELLVNARRCSAGAVRHAAAAVVDAGGTARCRRHGVHRHDVGGANGRAAPRN